MLGILICNFHNFTGRTQTHTGTYTHTHLLNLIFTLNFYEARSTQKTLSLRTTYDIFCVGSISKIRVRLQRLTMLIWAAAAVPQSLEVVAGGTRWIAGLSAPCSMQHVREKPTTTRRPTEFTFDVWIVLGILLVSFMLQLYLTMILGQDCYCCWIIILS